MSRRHRCFVIQITPTQWIFFLVAIITSLVVPLDHPLTFPFSSHSWDMLLNRQIDIHTSIMGKLGVPAFAG